MSRKWVPPRYDRMEFKNPIPIQSRLLFRIRENQHKARTVGRIYMRNGNIRVDYRRLDYNPCTVTNSSLHSMPMYILHTMTGQSKTHSYYHTSKKVQERILQLITAEQI
jgi:hypothetical protein